LEEIEEVFVEFLVEMSTYNRPLSVNEGIDLVNSLIEGTKYEKAVRDFQEKFCAGTMKEDTVKGKVGKGYWMKFMERHQNNICAKRCEKYAGNRTNWSTYSNFDQMYNACYSRMLLAGLAIPLPEPVYMNKLGKVVEKGDPSAYGLPVMNELIHPDWLLFMDEMGINMNQKEDGHNGGEKYMCTPGTTPKIACATNEHRATIIPFVAASGHTVICAIIFQGESNNIPSSWILGRDISVTNPVRNDRGEIIQGEINAGKGKYFPGGPTCNFRGCKIPCQYYMTPSGGVNANILVDILQTLDKMNVYDHKKEKKLP